jgi:hypothetical protein
MATPRLAGKIAALGLRCGHLGLHEWLPVVQLLPLVIVELASVRLVRAAESDRWCAQSGRVSHDFVQMIEGIVRIRISAVGAREGQPPGNE